MEIVTLSENDFNLTYMGDPIYVREDYVTKNGYNLRLLEGLRNPIDYSISNDNFIVLTEQKNNQSVFKSVKPGIRNIDQTALSAVGQNLEPTQISLSAIKMLESPETMVAMFDGGGFSVLSNEYNFSTYFRVDINYITIIGDEITITAVANEDDLTNKNFVFLQFVDSVNCNIIINQNKEVKALTYVIAEDTFKALPLSVIDDGAYIRNFNYSYNSVDNDILLIVPDRGVISPSPDSDELILLPFSEIDGTIFWNILPTNNIGGEIKIEKNYFSLYGAKNQIVEKHTVDNHSIITENYRSSRDRNSNFVTLKTNVLYDNSYNDVTPDNTSFYRDYTSLDTGPRGENGYPNIILSYNNTNYKYAFKSDNVTYFHIPSNLGKWDRININDTSLIANGAVGGDSPLNSDKVFKYLYEYADFKNTGQTVSLDNGLYLCSWLFYDPVDPRESIWLDRYYNPDKIKKLNALSESGWNFISNLENIVEKSSKLSQSEYGNYYKEFDKDIGVFDVVSKLTFEPNVLYLYYHIGANDSRKLFDELSSSMLVKHEDITLDYSNTIKLDTSANQSEGDFSLSFTLDSFNIGEFKGGLLLGNDEYGLYFDESYTPFKVAYRGNEVLIYDFRYSYQNQITFFSDVKHVIYLDSYKDFLVIDIDNTIYNCNVNGYFRNYTTEFALVDFIDHYYKDGKLYLFCNDGYIYTFNANTLDLTVLYLVPPSSNLLFVRSEDDISVKVGSMLDYDSEGNAYIVSDPNGIYKNDSESILLSSSDVKKILIDSDDNLFAIIGDTIYNVDQSNFSPSIVESRTLSGFDALSGTGVVSANITKILENGITSEYIDILYDDIVHRFDKNLNEIESIELGEQGLVFADRTNYTNLKYQPKSLKFKIKLHNIFNDERVENIVFTVSDSILTESQSIRFNITLSNKFGNVTLYCNGRKIDSFSFDPQKYFYMVSNNAKMFIGGDNINDEEFVYEIVDNVMVSGSVGISDIYIHNTYLSYFDVINYNKMRYESPTANLVIPIKSRSYTEEVEGFFIQNKNLRKSEFGKLDIFSKGLTDSMKDETKKFIESTVSDTFINNTISDINIYQDDN